jgi:hypothetical protein
MKASKKVKCSLLEPMSATSATGGKIFFYRLVSFYFRLSLHKLFQSPYYLLCYLISESVV